MPQMHCGTSQETCQYPFDEYLRLLSRRGADLSDIDLLALGVPPEAPCNRPELGRRHRRTCPPEADDEIRRLRNRADSAEKLLDWYKRREIDRACQEPETRVRDGRIS